MRRRSHPERISSLVVERDDRLIAFSLIENGRDVVHYVVETGTPTRAHLPGSVQGALDLAGVWSDLDWDETVEALERIRHESQPTPPIDSTALCGVTCSMTPLTAYLKGIDSARELVHPWIVRREAATTILVYGEVTEYNKSFPDIARRQEHLRRLLREVSPYFPTFTILERYAELRRHLRQPHGPGLIGDIDTLIAATALEHGRTLVTTDTDFERIPDLRLNLLRRRT